MSGLRELVTDSLPVDERPVQTFASVPFLADQSPLGGRDPDLSENPRASRWKYDLCHEPDDDLKTCCEGYWFPFSLFGKVNYRLKQIKNKKDPLDESNYNCCNGACVSLFFLNLCFMSFPLIMVTQARVRGMFDIDGSCCDDFARSYFCGPCTLMVLDREIRARDLHGRAIHKAGNRASLPINHQPPLHPDMIAPKNGQAKREPKIKNQNAFNSPALFELQELRPAKVRNQSKLSKQVITKGNHVGRNLCSNEMDRRDGLESPSNSLTSKPESIRGKRRLVSYNSRLERSAGDTGPSTHPLARCETLGDVPDKAHTKEGSQEEVLVYYDDDSRIPPQRHRMADCARIRGSTPGMATIPCYDHILDDDKENTMSREPKNLSSDLETDKKSNGVDGVFPGSLKQHRHEILDSKQTPFDTSRNSLREHSLENCSPRASVVQLQPAELHQLNDCTQSIPTTLMNDPASEYRGNGQDFTERPGQLSDALRINEVPLQDTTDSVNDDCGFDVAPQENFSNIIDQHHLTDCNDAKIRHSSYGTLAITKKMQLRRSSAPAISPASHVTALEVEPRNVPIHNLEPPAANTIMNESSHTILAHTVNDCENENLSTVTEHNIQPLEQLVVQQHFNGECHEQPIRTESTLNQHVVYGCDAVHIVVETSNALNTLNQHSLQDCGALDDQSDGAADKIPPPNSSPRSIEATSSGLRTPSAAESALRQLLGAFGGEPLDGTTDMIESPTVALDIGVTGPAPTVDARGNTKAKNRSRIRNQKNKSRGNNGSKAAKNSTDGMRSDK